MGDNKPNIINVMRKTDNGNVDPDMIEYGRLNSLNCIPETLILEEIDTLLEQRIGLTEGRTKVKVSSPSVLTEKYIQYY